MRRKIDRIVLPWWVILLYILIARLILPQLGYMLSVLLRRCVELADVGCSLTSVPDKTTLSYAAIFGISAKETGLDLHGTQYSWLSSIFYFVSNGPLVVLHYAELPQQGWLAWSIPSNLIMQKVPPVTYLAINIFLWGVFLMLQAVSHNFATLAALRTISGAFESIADPAFMLITSMWYKSEEQPCEVNLQGACVTGG